MNNAGRLRRASWPARTRRFRATRLLATLLATSCRASAAPAPDPPSPVPELVVTMVDHRFEYDPSIPSGPVLFRVDNVGSVAHDLRLIPLDDDVPAIEEQLRGTQRRVVTPLAAVRPRPPGTDGAFVVDLEPGRRYALICSLITKERQAHSRLGMASEFRAGP